MPARLAACGDEYRAPEDPRQAKRGDDCPGRWFESIDVAVQINHAPAFTFRAVTEYQAENQWVERNIGKSGAQFLFISAYPEQYNRHVQFGQRVRFK